MVGRDKEEGGDAGEVSGGEGERHVGEGDLVGLGGDDLRGAGECRAGSPGEEGSCKARGDSQFPVDDSRGHLYQPSLTLQLSVK